MELQEIDSKIFAHLNRHYISMFDEINPPDTAFSLDQSFREMTFKCRRKADGKHVWLNARLYLKDGSIDARVVEM